MFNAIRNHFAKRRAYAAAQEARMAHIRYKVRKGTTSYDPAEAERLRCAMKAAEQHYNSFIL